MARKCPKCDGDVPYRVVIDGKERFLNSRKYCLECSPFGMHNTKNLMVSEKERQRRDKSGSNVIEYRREAKRTCVAYCGGKCEICEYNKCMSALVFHHLDPNGKDFGLSGKSIAWKNIKPELDKCVMLCSNCHFEIHADMIEVPDKLSERIVPDNKYTRERVLKPKKKTRPNKALKPFIWKVQRPPYKQLLQEIKETNQYQVSKKYGVSWNSVTKWIKMYEKYGDINEVGSSDKI